MNAQPLPTVLRRLSGIRINAFAALVMLIVQYSLGIWVTLYGQRPSSNSGFWGAFVDSIVKGPLAVSIHAALGTLIVLSSLTLVFRTIRVHHGRWMAPAFLGLAAVVIAWLSGTRFVAAGGTLETSLGMGLATGGAMLMYGFIMFSVAFAEVDTAWVASGDRGAFDRGVARAGGARETADTREVRDQPPPSEVRDQPPANDVRDQPPPSQGPEQPPPGDEERTA